jgi:ssDNA-binding replication factor A large subunit
MQTESIVQKILAKTSISTAELDAKIAEKQRELSGLVSREGAAYIIAREMGLDFFTQRAKPRLEIKNVVPGIKSLDITARVFRVFEPREFTRNGAKSAVSSLVLADGTGTIRLSLWDQQVTLAKDLKPGVAVEISGAYTKPDLRGGAEIRLGKRGTLRVLEKSDLPPIENIRQTAAEMQRITIASLKEGASAEIRAAIVQLFESNPFFVTCPTCGGRAKRDVTGTTKCPTHGVVQPKIGIVLSGVIDDGTGNIRVVFFRDSALTIAGMKMEEAIEKGEDLVTSLDVLGKEFIISGRVRKNQLFNRLELIADSVRQVDTKAEAEKLLAEMKGA